MNKFVKGFMFGTISTIGTVVGAVMAFNKVVVKPIEEEEQRFEENRRRATRKQRSAHNG